MAGMASWSVRSHGPLVVVAIKGEVDVAAVGRLEQSVRALDLTGVQTVEFDLTGVTFASSSALALLLRARQRVEESGAAMVVVVRDGAVRRLFEMTHVDRMLTVINNGP
jgi:anti-anti-sigma factor